MSGDLGPLADTDGEIDIEIRDLDQAVIGNPAHDLIPHSPDEVAILSIRTPVLI
jgi:uncharacterized protein (DUF2252 family)